MARKAKARKCSAEAAGNVQAKVERQHRLWFLFLSSHHPEVFPKGTPKQMCVICPHKSAGMVSLCGVKSSSSLQPPMICSHSELELFQIDRLARLYGIQKLLRRRKLLDRLQNLISPCTTSVCKKKVILHNFLKTWIV